jgi:hypothetical protein
MIETLQWLGILIMAAFRERLDLALENVALTTAGNAQTEERGAET